MKKFICIVIAALLLSGFAVSAADKTPATHGAKKEYEKQEAARTAKMNAAGRVLEISAKSITIERSVRDMTETMTFALDKQVKNIAIGDLVSVAYVIKNEKLIAVSVNKSEKNISTKQPLEKTAR